MAHTPDVAAKVDAFRRLIQNELKAFLVASREFGMPLSALADKVQRAFQHELSYIDSGAKTLRTERIQLADLIEKLSRAIRDIQDFRDRNRQDPEFSNHLAAVADSIVALSWITVERTPAIFIRDMRDAGDYFGNRVLSANKGNPQHIDWWGKWTAVLKALEDYVRQHYLTGFTFAEKVVPQHGAIPPPPPPPPEELFSTMSGGDNLRNALLNELNQGVNITQMLRPSRGSGDAQVRRPRAPVVEQAVPQPSAPMVAPAIPQAQAPKFALEGRKWRVEHFKNATGLTVVANEMSETLAMFKCENTEVDVQNKINGATIDNCKRSTVVFRDVISTVELIRCQRMTIQCIGHVPSINLDSCDSVQLFLGENSVDTEIITSKTTSLNICLLSNDGDYVELAVPEQIKTTIVNGSLQSSVVQQI